METVLHFHDDVFACRCQAIKVVDDTRVVQVVGVILLVQEGQVLYLVLTGQQLVQ